MISGYNEDFDDRIKTSERFIIIVFVKEECGKILLGRTVFPLKQLLQRSKACKSCRQCSVLTVVDEFDHNSFNEIENNKE